MERVRVSTTQDLQRSGDVASGVLLVQSEMQVFEKSEVIMQIEVRQSTEVTAGLSDRECRRLLRDIALRYLDPA